MISCIIPESSSDSCAQNFFLKFNKLKEEKKALTTGGLGKVLKDMMCYSGNNTSNTSSTANRANLFTVRSSVFRLVIESATGNQERKLEAVIERLMPKDKKHGRNRQKVKRSYRLLYWKLI